MECGYPDCTNSGKITKGYCRKHYIRLVRHGDPSIAKHSFRGQDASCSAEGCDRRPESSEGLCLMHAKRMRRNGTLELKRVLRSYSDTDECQEHLCEVPPTVGGYCRNHYMKYLSAERRSKKQENGVFVLTQKDIDSLPKSCIACGSTDSLQLEHLIPIVRGGQHSIGNVTTLCKSCNSSKRELTWTEWKYSGRPRARALFKVS